MEATRDLVSAATELSASVEGGHDDFECGFLLLGVTIDRDAAAIIDHGHNIVTANGAGDGIADSSQRFIDRIVDEFADEVVQAALVGAANVHAGALANGFEALENLNLLGTIRLVHCRSILDGHVGGNSLSD